MPRPSDLVAEPDFAAVDEQFTETERSVVPTIDSEHPVATYQTWAADKTRVVMYTVGTTAYPGKYAETRAAARADCLLVHGKIYEANYVKGRAFFRVPRARQP